MKISNPILFTLIILALLSSCQKNNHQVNPDQAKISLKTPEGMENLAPMETVKTFEKDFSKNANLVVAADKRFLLNDSKNSNARKGNTLKCNATLKGSTKGRTNIFSSSIYKKYGANLNGKNMDGNDYYVVLEGKASDNETILFSELTKGAGVFFFRANKKCHGVNCTYSLASLIKYDFAKQNNDQILIERSPNPDEIIIIVVDVPQGEESNFVLERACNLASSLCILDGADRFQQYDNGALTEQSCHWSKWFPRAEFDANVVGRINQYAEIQRIKHTPAFDQPDVLLHVDNGNPIKHIRFNLYVPPNRTAYFNIQKDLKFNNIGNEVGAAVYFDLGGQGRIYINNRAFRFTYQPGQWIEVFIDAHNDFQNFFGIHINNQLVLDFPTDWQLNSHRGSNSLEAINFYPYRADSHFFIDNVSIGD
jgi:hypothetical protein